MTDHRLQEAGWFIDYQGKKLWSPYHVVERHVEELLTAVTEPFTISDDGLDYLTAAFDLYEILVKAIQGEEEITAEDLRWVLPIRSAWSGDEEARKNLFKYMATSGQPNQITKEVWLDAVDKAVRDLPTGLDQEELNELDEYTHYCFPSQD